MKGALYRLLSLSGLLRVRVCPLCAALVLAAGESQHARVHVTETGR